MKRFFVLTTLLACLVCNLTASAESLYRGNVLDVIDAFKLVGNELGFSLWGTKYYTYKGINRCELHFGNSQNNLIRFRLNNDDSVARMLITIPNSDNVLALESGMEAGILAVASCIAYGVNEKEAEHMWESFTVDVFDNIFSSHMHKKYYAWSSRTRQYIVMDVEWDMSKLDLYFYPE